MQVNLREGLLQASSHRSDDLPQGAEGLAQEVLQEEGRPRLGHKVGFKELPARCGSAGPSPFINHCVVGAGAQEVELGDL